MTGEIEKRLAGMQIHVEHAVCSIADTVRQIGSLADAASAIQTAVARQQHATEKIHADAGEASISTASLHDQFSAVASATSKAGLLSGSIREAANLVACDTASLRDAATQFIERLRKAYCLAQPVPRNANLILATAIARSATLMRQTSEWLSITVAH